VRIGGRPRPNPWVHSIQDDDGRPTVNDPRTFFQVAASLIPAIVFGGFISDRLKPSKTLDLAPGRKWAAAFVAVCVASAVLLAEIFAVQAGLAGAPTLAATILVACVLTLSTATTICLIVAPWIAKRSRVRILGLCGACFVIAGTFILTDAVRSEQHLQTAAQQLAQTRRYVEQELADLRQANTLNATGYDKALEADLQVRAQYGLLSHAAARRMRVCLADHIYRRTVRRYNSLLQIVGIPPPPGKHIDC
jgi:hypothetical protein